MDVVDDQETWGEEDREGSGVGGTFEGWRGRLNEALGISEMALNTIDTTYRCSAYTRTSSVAITLALWKYTVCQLSYSKLYTLNIAGSIALANCERNHSKYAKNGG
jgi:hypothetical protein